MQAVSLYIMRYEKYIVLRQIMQLNRLLEVKKKVHFQTDSKSNDP